MSFGGTNGKKGDLCREFPAPAECMRLVCWLKDLLVVAGESKGSPRAKDVELEQQIGFRRPPAHASPGDPPRKTSRKSKVKRTAGRK